MNLYLGQDKGEESVSLLLFFQTGMSSLSSPWVQISLVLQAHCQGAFPDSPVHTNLCLLGSVPYNLAPSYVNLASQANLRMWVSLALLGPLGLCQPTGTPHVGCLLDQGMGGEAQVGGARQSTSALPLLSSTKLPLLLKPDPQVTRSLS